MTPRIETIAEKKIIGLVKNMTLAHNTTSQLWQEFMPRRSEIGNGIGEDLYSIQSYPNTFTFNNSNMHILFEKFAGREVTAFENIPEGMDSMIIPSGLYAVFIHRGTPLEFGRTFGYIFQEWLPNSGYSLSPRPHFEILDSRYKHMDPNSEEEVWIPIHKLA